MVMKTLPVFTRDRRTGSMKELLPVSKDQLDPRSFRNAITVSMQLQGGRGSRGPDRTALQSERGDG